MMRVRALKSETDKVKRKKKSVASRRVVDSVSPVIRVFEFGEWTSIMDEYDNGAASSAPTKRKTRARSVVAASKVAPAEAKKAKVAKSDGVG